MRNNRGLVKVTCNVPTGYKLQRLHAWDQLVFAWLQYVQRDTFHRKAIERLVLSVSQVVPKIRSSKLALVDLGCGPGLLLGELGRQNLFSRLVGVDFCAGMISLAQNRNLGHDINIEYQRLDLESRLPRNASLAQKFHIATAAFLLDEVGDAVACFRSVATFLRPGGYFVTAMLVPERERARYASRLKRLPSNSAGPVLLSKIIKLEGHVAPVSYFRLLRPRDEILQIAASAGFDKLRDQSISAARLHSRPQGPFLRLLVFQLKP
jgi:2-polyprenyl-3-methyl-5-hydroxy-6-metoxy-1,4-benzoquinol methylase